MSSAPTSLVTTDVALAVAALRGGGLVALPTETVYGLGADARDHDAVARVFTVKGRPADHPLIVHVAGPADLDSWARDVPTYARRLAADLWPGPLTLVLRRSAWAHDVVTGGHDTVALRAPAHLLAHEVITRLGGGIAAPSANRFGRVSPTSAEHVLSELGTLLVPGTDLILDGGSCRIGVESTIVDCTGPAPRLLRPGAVTPADIAAAGGVRLAAAPSRTAAPGTLPSHYAPRACVEVCDTDTLDAVLSVAETSGEGTVDGRAPVVGLLALADVTTPVGVLRLSAPADVDAYARVLYAALREADAFGLRHVVAVAPPPDGVGAAVRDRLVRAASGSREPRRG